MKPLTISIIYFIEFVLYFYLGLISWYEYPRLSTINFAVSIILVGIAVYYLYVTLEEK